MPTVAEKPYYTFVKGLNTEGGPLTSVPDTWRAGTNMVPDTTGLLYKRWGIDYESGYALSSGTNTTSEKENLAFTFHEWNSVAGVGSRNFIAAQRGTTLYFYDNRSDGVSSTIKGSSINLASYIISGSASVLGSTPIQTASANGKLIVVGETIRPFVCTYDADTGTISAETIGFYIRDFEGVDDGYAVDEYPHGTLSAEHKYNLFNQGWDQTKIDAWYTYAGNYPSNAQSWTAGKDSSDDFSAALLAKQDFGTSPAPKGRYILEALYRDRSGVSGVAGIDPISEIYNPTTVAFFAGRAWYAGQESDTIGSWIFFSQVAETSDKLGNCYQDADPTSEVISDLVDSDGGIIVIQDVGTVLKLVPAFNSMLVLASNGVWQILGGADTGFSATSYEVRKLSSTGCVSAASVVEADNIIMFWGPDDIWAITPNAEGNFTVQSVTVSTIATFYSALPKGALANVHGVYFNDAGVVEWSYKSDGDGVVNRFVKDTILCLDIALGAFYTKTIASLASSSPLIVGAVVAKTGALDTDSYTVVAGADTVIAGADTVVASVTTTASTASKMVYPTLVPTATNTWKLTFSNEVDGSDVDALWVDWFTADGVGASFDAYLDTYYDMGAEQQQGGAKYMQGVYFVAFFNRSETGIDVNGDPVNPSSCTLSARWNWADSSTSGKWGTAQQIYRHRRLYIPDTPDDFDTGIPVLVTKTKIRGRGRSVYFRLQGAAGHDLQINGWHVIYTGNENV